MVKIQQKRRIFSKKLSFFPLFFGYLVVFIVRFAIFVVFTRNRKQNVQTFEEKNQEVDPSALAKYNLHLEIPSYVEDDEVTAEDGHRDAGRGDSVRSYPGAAKTASGEEIDWPCVNRNFFGGYFVCACGGATSGCEKGGYL